MADYENSVDIILEMQTKLLLDAFGTINKSMKDMQTTYKATMQMMASYAKPFKDLTLAANHLENINMDKFKRNINTVTVEVARLGSKLNGFGVQQFQKNVYSMADAMNQFNRSMKNISKIPTVFDVLKNADFSSLDKINISPVQRLVSELGHLDASNLKGVGNAINNISKSMNAMKNLNLDISLPNNVQNQMNTAAETLRSFVEKISKFNLNGLKGFARDIKVIPKAMQAMESLDVSKIGQVFSTLTTQIQPFLAHLKEASSELNALSNILNKMGRRGVSSGLKSIQNEIYGIGKESDKTRRKFSNMLTAGKIYALYNQVRHFGSGFANMLNKSIDFTEIENYFSRAMGNMRNEAMKFQNTLSDMYGLAMPSMMKAQATFKNQLSSLGGLTDDMSYMLSERLTKMALDFSSLYNTSIDSAMTKFQAAISRQVRPIRSVSGYDITQNVLSATMKEIGINDRKIAQLNEMEKRLLIILTLQQQMARSAAMNDFARTINQPANQLKVLQQQIAEVGRWISAVFYGVIGQVLPYINGFVMAIKSLIQMFASFLGYELPDSSGQTGTILDGFEESMGGVSDGIDDINSGLDGTNSGLDKATKKAKELAGALGIDELNTFGKNTDDSSGSGGSGGSGSGGIGSIDPRILKALEDMDYLFDSIRMKAHEIRDQLLSWSYILGNIIDENIFQPISNSWDKYGSSIVGNILDTRDNIVHILSGVFDVIEDKWIPFFSALSDLFFSLMDTVSLVSSTITKFLRHVWDAGGKYLFESIWDLATAFLKLATSINDNFVKPVIRWFKNSIAPVFGDLVGIILKGIGSIVKGFANVIEWIAKCKPAVILLSSAFTGLFLTIKVAKILELASALGGSHTILKAFKMTVFDGNPIFKKMFNIFASGKASFESIKNTWKASNIVLQNTTLFTKAKEAADKLAAISAGIHAKATDGLTLSQQICATSSGTLATALNFLANHPMVIMVGAIAAVVGAIALFNSSQKESKYEMEDYSKSIQDQIKKIDELTESLNEASSAAKKNEDERLIDLIAVQRHVDALQKLAGDSGYVDNIAKANKLIEEINTILPESVSLTKEGRIEWSKTPSEIFKNIEALKEKAKVEAYQALYVESIKAQIKAENEQAIAREKYAQIEYRILQINARLKELYKLSETSEYGKYVDEIARLNKELKQNEADLDGAQKAVDKAGKAVEKATKQTESYEKSMDNLANSSKNATKTLNLSYAKMSDSGNKAMNSLGTKMLEVIRQQEQYTKDGKSLNDIEVRQTAEAKKVLIDKYAEQALKYKKSYEDMLAILEQQGIKLSEEEKKQLENSMNKKKEIQDKELENFKKSKDEVLKKLKDSNVKMSDETKKGYSDMLQALHEYGIKVDSKNTEIYKKMYDILKKSGSDMNTEQQKQYSQFLGALQQNGVDITTEKASQYRAMYESFSQYNIEVNSEQGRQYSRFLSKMDELGIDIQSKEGQQHTKSYLEASKAGTEIGDEYISRMKKGVSSKDINSELDAIINKAKNKVDSKPVYMTIKAYMDKYSLDNVVHAMSSAVSSLKFHLNVDSVQSKGSASMYYTQYATGGFPNIGELFIANEKGPEMIGKMGNRNVIANNNQIVAGIEAGVTRGTIAALERAKSGTQSGNVVIENHIHVDVDGREIAEVVDEVKLRDGYDFGMGRK